MTRIGSNFGNVPCELVNMYIPLFLEIVFFFFFKDFIYLFDREKSQVGREAGRERGGSRLPAEQKARYGA